MSPQADASAAPLRRGAVPARGRGARRFARGARVAIGLAAVLAGGGALPRAAAAEDAGTLVVAQAEDAAVPARGSAGVGRVVGRVFDSEKGSPVSGATVTIAVPAAEGTAPRQATATTGADGSFALDGIPAGTHTIQFAKPGYRASTLDSVVVEAGKSARADFPLPPGTTASAEQVLELEAFPVEVSTVGEGADAIELRTESDQLLNILSAEDLSKFAAGDVGEALRRVAGVNVVSGQFVVIRGLDDRYNSTLFNGAPIPSPDPDRQSVQLDLFPSDVVTNLVVSKTFAPELPSNSSGGSVGISTIPTEVPEGLEIKINAGSGFNTRALQRFLRLDEGSPVGVEQDPKDVIEHEYGGTLRGSTSFFGRQLRLKGVFNQELDFETAEGVFHAREPSARVGSGNSIRQSGDLSLGQLSATNGLFDLTESERSEQRTGYVGLGGDLDPEGNHKIDATWFYTKKETESVQLRENGFFPNFDYDVCAQAQREADESLQDNCLIVEGSRGNRLGLGAWFGTNFRELDPGSGTGILSGRGYWWSDAFQDSQSFDTDRNLKVYQLNGDHRTELVDGLHLTWAVNRAKTTQTENVERFRYAYPAGPGSDSQEGFIPTAFPVQVTPFEGGRFYTLDYFENSVEVEEESRFGRVDLEYEFEPVEPVALRLNTGLWYEDASRDAFGRFLQDARTSRGSQWVLLADTPRELSSVVDEEILQGGFRDVTSEAERKIKAWHFGGKVTFWDRVDLLGGLRRESIEIRSLNDAFTGEFYDQPGALPPIPARIPRVFPALPLFFDRRDNPNRASERPRNFFNDPILNLAVPINPLTGFVDFLTREEIESVLNGVIDDRDLLPSIGFNIRPIEGLSLRGAYSRTIARPSFREIGYYVSVDPGTDDFVVGNPQLQLSEVSSWDARLEYNWGSLGDLAAVSVFYKEIDDPIESIVVRDPENFEGGSSTALFRTFFNNANQATLRGIELEARKNLGILGFDLARYITIGGNVTYIDASVKRSPEEIARSAAWFGVRPGDRERVDEYEEERRLFNQPSWTANVDLSFKQPDWGTELTLAFYAISDVLDAAGTASLDAGGQPFQFLLDRYVDSFHQLDLVFSQRFELRYLPGAVTFKTSAKNLTDSRRELVYDPEQTREKIAERSFRVGRDFSFSLSYTVDF